LSFELLPPQTKDEEGNQERANGNNGNTSGMGVKELALRRQADNNQLKQAAREMLCVN
jgi:hypothetical protein